MKHAALALAIMASAAVFAQAPAKPHVKPAPMVAKKMAKVLASLHCAVMPRHAVNVKDATRGKLFADYKGRRYYFCCAGCPASFKANPAKFAKTAQSNPVPAAPKPAKAS